MLWQTLHYKQILKHSKSSFSPWYVVFSSFEVKIVVQKLSLGTSLYGTGSKGDDQEFIKISEIPAEVYSEPIKHAPSRRCETPASVVHREVFPWLTPKP